MLDGNVIEVRNIKKQFRVYQDKGSSLKERILFRERNQYEVRSVLRGVSFSIKKGEAVGLVGHNGCGKSTTLKLLTRIIYPDSGEIEIKGRISSLLELGAGFHPDMSGRDNIYINASIFGLTRQEIDARLEDIIAFSELGDYIDNPVRTYSSGMYMRLAFSVAINVDADVLLIDEILSVGDANFQKKCMNKMRQIKNQGTTIVIVSHSLEQIESFCERSIWINDGLVAAIGAPYPVHLKYLRYMGGLQLDNTLVADDDKTQEGEKEVKSPLKLEKVSIEDITGKNKKIFERYESMVVNVSYTSSEKIEGNIKLSVIREDNVHCYETQYQIDNDDKAYQFEKEGALQITFNNLLLLENGYRISISVIEKETGKELCFDESAEFQVKDNDEERGVFHMTHCWEQRG